MSNDGDVGPDPYGSWDFWVLHLTVAFDVNGDGMVDVNDLNMILELFGSACDDCSADVNGDGVVGMDDLMMMMAVL